VDDVSCVARRLADSVRVEDVGLDEGQVRVLCQLTAGHRIAVQVVQDHDLVVLHQASRQGRADEARSAGQEDAFAGQRHGGECIGASRGNRFVAAS